MAPPAPGVLCLKQGDSAGCHCYIFPGLRNWSANCEPDAPHGFPQQLPITLLSFTVKETELQRCW